MLILTHEEIARLSLVVSLPRAEKKPEDKVKKRGALSQDLAW